MRRKDGSTFPALIEDRIVHNEAGAIIGIRAVIQDITHRKLAEEELRWKTAFLEAVEAAFGLGDESKVEEVLAIAETLPPGELPPFLRAQATRFRARLAQVRDQPEGAESGFKAATGMLRELGMPFWMAVTMVEHAEWLAQQGRTHDAKPVLDEAREIFEGLKAARWLDRVERVASGLQVTA